MKRLLFGLTMLSCLCVAEDLKLEDLSRFGCDKNLDNSFFKTCYDYKHKGAIASYTKLIGENVDKGNIKEREHFYDDVNIPEEYRTKDSDYTNRGFDRGHVNGDASFDWSEESLHATYALSNIVPQYPKTNRISYLNVEKEERAQAKALGYVEVQVQIEYNSGVKMKDTDVPSAFNILIYNNEKNFKECFHVKNDNIAYDLSQTKVDCKN